MAEQLKSSEYSNGWNPWHGCTKISAGCRYCYVYRQDERYGSAVESSLCRKTASFDLPVRKNRAGGWKIPSGAMIYTCFTSDFLLRDADEWRGECWRMIRQRSDCAFFFITKRIDRLAECLPPDWGEGYENVLIGCTVENQDRADFRLPIFRSLPIRHRAIIASPLLERLDLTPYLDESIEEITAGGESGQNVRPCDYDWVLSLREQSVAANVPFHFQQTGANFIRNGRSYSIPRREQHAQARKAGLDFRIRPDGFPETADWMEPGRDLTVPAPPEEDAEQFTIEL